MVAFLKTILTLALSAILAAFAVLNQDQMSLVYSPIHDAVLLPESIVILGAMGAGFFLGAVVVWFSGGKDRRLKREAQREARHLHKELDKMEHQSKDDGQSDPGSDFFPSLPKPYKF